MTGLTVIENKISAARKYLTILAEFRKHTRKAIQEDITIRGAVERYLYLAVQSAIDLGEAVISYKNFRKPTTMGETFLILAEERIIPRELADRLVKMAGFRNVIAHDYEEVNYDIVYDVLQNQLHDIESFVAAVSNIR